MLMVISGKSRMKETYDLSPAFSKVSSSRLLDLLTVCRTWSTTSDPWRQTTYTLVTRGFQLKLNEEPSESEKQAVIRLYFSILINGLQIVDTIKVVS